jgi:hypothetical protein
MSDEQIITVELDPNVWMRGGMGSLLISAYPLKPRQQCCIGVACTAFGMPDAVILGSARLDDLDTDDVTPAPFQSVIKMRTTGGVGGNNFSVLEDRLEGIYEVNDDPDVSSDAARVALINAELENIGAAFRFTLKPADGNQLPNAVASGRNHGSEAQKPCVESK